MTSTISSSASTDTFVTYETRHPTGFTYKGKSSIRRIQNGYQGSGPKFNCVLKHPGFEPSTWTTTILSQHDSEADAYAAEALLVPLTLLTDPFCLNTSPGGKTRCYGSPYTKLLKSFKKPREKKTNKQPPKSRIKTRLVMDKEGTVTIEKGNK